MGRKMSGEIERICQVFEQLTQEYNRRFSDLEKAYLNGAPLRVQNDGKGPMKQELELISLQRAQIWFLDAIQSTSLDLYERTVTMLEGALYHKDDAESRLGDAYTPVRRENNDIPQVGINYSPGDFEDTAVDDGQFYKAIPNSDIHDDSIPIPIRQPSLNVFNMKSIRTTSPSAYADAFSQRPKISNLTSK